MAAGIPCVASNFPLWREMVVEPGVGMVANPLSARDIADAVLAIVEDPNAAATMGQRGRRWVEAHRNWAQEETEMLALYSDLRAES